MPARRLRPCLAASLVAALVALVAVVQARQAAVSPAPAATFRAHAAAAVSPIAGELGLDGLAAAVEVIRDRWGVAHIYASTLEDLFFAQGFVAAQDRLWQMDLWRRTAMGELSEALGPAFVTRDTLARLLRYRGDMDAEWRAYSPDARRIVEAIEYPFSRTCQAAQPIAPRAFFIRSIP